ncbi:hypothetical protein XA68_11895 [Ophiocordyceps unilateralis]|uniref:Mediator of RNA polymerase II transcription subunit 18 n=1 Tax=Ophiocordyceps unilateralis TaxID=268505 RepID=A0A2A9PFX6_OPHUN|nr:hypothetical protein XA68_11895 [Ophiocordyceps unilateralis]
MYELFLTALVEQADFQAACAVLGGLCAMPPWHTLSRVLYFQGPPKPSGIANQASIDKPVRKDAAFLWKDLHQSLSRQSFVVQARYDIARDVDLGASASPMDLDATAGILRWADFPDPPHGRPLLTQRKMVEIWEQKKLPSIMGDNHLQYKTETIEEECRFFRDDIEFRLTRQYLLHPIRDYTPLESRTQPPSGPTSSLPEWEALTAVDKQRRWILHVKTHVLQDNKPDEIRKAQDRLMSIRTELDGVFDFKTVDRKVHDTRIAMQQQGIQALPQKVILGKT